MLYHGIFVDDVSTVRSADEGLTDQEWSMGVRIFGCDYASKLTITDRLLDKGYEVLTKDAWNAFINGDETVLVDKYISTNRVVETLYEKSTYEARPIY